MAPPVAWGKDFPTPDDEVWEARKDTLLLAALVAVGLLAFVGFVVTVQWVVRLVT